MLEAIKFIYYHFCCFLVRVLSFIFCPVKTFGKSNLPKEGGFLLASNHQSHLDPALIPSFCPRRLRFIAKDSLFRNPIAGAIISFGGGIPIKRGKADRGALDRVVQELEKGYGILIFPQGTRGGEKIQAGVGFLTAQTGKPVVPLYIEGTDKVLPKGAKFPRRGPVRMIIGKPLRFSKDTAYEVIAERVMEAVNALKPSRFEP
jgi:1-acyl-sn-glycerol-3-phosphate acyltransferase